MFPTSKWVFICASVDVSANTQYGYRYYPSSGGTIAGLFNSLSPTTGSLYTITPSTTIFWGGDGSGADCNCLTQYVRVYIDYAPNAQDQMLNLALMYPLSKINYFEAI